jgi:hypothetical protein
LNKGKEFLKKWQTKNLIEANDLNFKNQSIPKDKEEFRIEHEVKIE